MSVKLQKGQKVSLSKENPGLSKIIVGLGWDEARPQQQKGGFLSSLFAAPVQDIDCDASAFVLRNGRLVNSRDVVYFGNLTHESGAIRHMGDNLTGGGDGDDEQIMIDLQKVPPIYDKIAIVVNIYKAYSRNQHFGMIQNAFIRVVNGQNGRELVRYNLTEDYGGMTAMIFGEVYRHDGEWKFAAIGSGTKDDSISSLAKRYQ